MSLKPKARELLLRVREAILEEPARIRMAWWRIDPDVQGFLVDRGEHAAMPACGTVGCIAGWTVELGLKNPRQVKYICRSAYRLLGWGRARSCPLFHVSRWPDDLRMREQNLAVTGTPEYAAVVAAAIDRFIADPEAFQ